MPVMVCNEVVIKSEGKYDEKINTKGKDGEKINSKGKDGEKIIANDHQLYQPITTRFERISSHE